jgi:hypothetical protein
MERIAPENQDAFDTTTASLAPKPVNRYQLQSLSDVDPMKEFLDMAKAMAVDQFYGKMSKEDAAKMVKAIKATYSETEYRTETHPDGIRVIRCAPRTVKSRAAKTPAKKAAEPKQKAAKNA